MLGRLARLMLRAVLMPMALALNRLMVAEAQRFPELAAIVAREGGQPSWLGRSPRCSSVKRAPALSRSTARNSLLNSSFNSSSPCRSAAPSASARR